ncbi:MAG: hypothetical protein JKX83_01010 [Pseudomonadales bacterium]|nr:hypothetical protein [Pseudomonadales bacterium]
MKKALSFWVLVVVSLLAMPVWSEQGLRAELEQSMLKARGAVMNADLKAFISSVDAINPHVRITRDQWSQLLANKLGQKLLLRSAQDLKNNTVFITVKTDGDWAGYYAETNLDDENYQTLNVFLFHRSSKGWRPAGQSYGLTKAKPGSPAALQYAHWKDHQDMLNTLETNRYFSIRNLVQAAAKK